MASKNVDIKSLKSVVDSGLQVGTSLVRIRKYRGVSPDYHYEVCDSYDRVYVYKTILGAFNRFNKIIN